MEWYSLLGKMTLGELKRIHPALPLLQRQIAASSIVPRLFRGTNGDPEKDSELTNMIGLFNYAVMRNQPPIEDRVRIHEEYIMVAEDYEREAVKVG